jgi:glycosyltransferase involved in cell wall biosynthesis
MATTSTHARPARTIAIVATSSLRAIQTFGTLVERLVADNQRVVVMAADTTPAMAERINALGANLETFPLQQGLPRTWGDRATRRTLTNILRQHAVHAVIASGPKTMALGAMAARASGAAKVVIHTDALTSIIDHPERGLPLRWRWLLRAGFNAADAVFCTTMDDQRALAAAGLMPAIKTLRGIAPAAVDLDQYALQALPAPADGIVFAGLCGNDRGAGAADFLRALAAVRAIAPTVRGLLTGPVVPEPAGLTRAELTASGDGIEFLAAPADARALLARAHVVVDTSGPGGNPGMIAQALALGRPVIASDVAGNRETVDAKVNGVLYPAGDVPSLIGAMENMLRRPDLLATMAKASRRKAERWFNAATVNAELIAELGLG